MESLEKKLYSLIFVFFISLSLFSQSDVTMPKLKVYLWSFLEPEPGINFPTDYDENFYTYAIRQLKKTAPYIFEGMIFGFSFDYTPYDKARQVNEFFEVSFQNENRIYISEFSKNIKYTDAKIENSIIYCWAEFPLTEDLYNRISRINSVSLKKIKGRGEAKLKEGEEGIFLAIENAIKDAVRNYARTITRNKPSEITGRLIISKEPRVYIKHGNYCVDVEFNLEEIKIYNYESF